MALLKRYMMTGGVLLAAEAAWGGLFAGGIFQRETWLPGAMRYLGR